MRYRDLMPSRLSLRVGIPALALGQGLAEAGFIFAARLGLTKGGYAVFGWLAILALLRFVFQDRIAVLETRAMREVVSGLRRRLLDVLRLRAVPAYRPDLKRDFKRALEETASRIGEGFLASERCRAAILQGLILIPCLFILSWRLALFALFLAFPAWLTVRWRSCSLRMLERSETEGRAEGRLALADFSEGLESPGEGGLQAAARRLESNLEKSQEPEWRWRLAQARYPAWLEMGFFFALAGLVMAGGASLGNWANWILFSGLLLLAYRPVREAGRHFPLSLQGAQALGDAYRLLREWEALPPRTLPEAHGGSALVFENVDFGYAPGQWVFRNFSAEFPADAITGITGPNGAGKTTLLRLLAGVEIPLRGKILWPGTMRQHGGIACLPQRIHPGSDWAQWARKLKEYRPVLWKELDDLLRLDWLTEKSLHPEALSGGERQRMALARVLSSDAPFLLMDEPTTALPGDERERILEGALRLWGRGAIIVSHEPFLGRVCEAMFALNGGEFALAARPGQPIR